MIMPAGSSVIASYFLRCSLEHGAELREPFKGILGDRARPVGFHQAGGIGIRNVQVEALNRHGLHGVQMLAQLVQSQQVGQAVLIAARARQAVNALSLVQGLEGLEVADQLT
jgi:hypothetical protein